MKTLILGLGNTILSDDGVGIKVVQELKKRLKPESGIDVVGGGIAGIALLDEIAGYDKLVLIDSIKTGKSEPGTLHKLTPEDFDTAEHLTYSHGVNFSTIVKFGEKLGYKMPGVIDVYAIEIEDNTTFGEKLTPQVDEKISSIVEEIETCLQR